MAGASAASSAGLSVSSAASSASGFSGQEPSETNTPDPKLIQRESETPLKHVRVLCMFHKA